MAEQPSPPTLESPDVRVADGPDGFALPSLVWTSPLRGWRQAQDGATRGSNSHRRQDTLPSLEWEARVLSNVVDLVGGKLFDLENFTQGNCYETCISMIKVARDLASLESDEGKNYLLYLCGWPIFHGLHYNEDRFLAAFAVERFRKKHDGVVGDYMPSQHYNRYLGFMWLLDSIQICTENNL
jgi:hypothetical protein